LDDGPIVGAAAGTGAVFRKLPGRNPREIGEKQGCCAMRITKKERCTWPVIWLCGFMMVAEIIGGMVFGSIALVVDGLHNPFE
jgi:Co/Zn/Cd efflux system component